MAKLKFRGIKASGGVLVCTLRVEMPIRTQAWGVMPPSVAAQIATKVASDASKAVRARSRSRKWVGEDFCIAWRDQMNAIFSSEQDRSVGGRAKKR